MIYMIRLILIYHGYEIAFYILITNLLGLEVTAGVQQSLCNMADGF